MRINTSLFILFCLCIGLSSAHAAHLVGGHLTYTCLGGNNYEVRLRIYRDCASGGAQFDATAAIAIYETNNAVNPVNVLNPAKGPTINVPANTTGNPCVTAPPGLCTEYAEYVDTVLLPPIAGGYTLSHQRCCRNASISNINATNVGNTYTITIPDMDIACNSSPEFTGIAPIVLCMGEAQNVKLEVNEADGDSLYFQICDIFEGGSSAGAGCFATIPNPPCPPPYTPVTFLPPFTSTNPLPASPAMAIDPQTGVLTGTPNQIGQYVFGVCVSEYRNNQLLSTTRLDYQFNVTSCIINVESDMVTPQEDPQILCDGLTVQFTSESVGASSYLWDFGDPSTSTDTSSLANPTYTYSTAGNYTVRLIANPGLPCGDTVDVLFPVKLPIIPNFQDSGIYCFEANEVYFKILGNHPANSTFSWDFGVDANAPTWLGENPPGITWTTPGKHYITLTITTGNCVWSGTDSLELSNLSVTVDAGSDQTVNEGDFVYLNARGGTQYYWYSDHAVDFSDPFKASNSALLTEGDDTVKFYVRVTDPLGCEGLDSLTVFVASEDAPINFISPNGDGKNEMLDLGSLNPDGDCSILIMNRWGSEVYSKSQYGNDWTGLNGGGNELPDGTYYFILQCGSEVRYKGPVTIMRY